MGRGPDGREGRARWKVDAAGVVLVSGVVCLALGDVFEQRVAFSHSTHCESNA